MTEVGHDVTARIQAGALKVVLFSGGRGSSVLSKELLKKRAVSLTLAINGYDDGASTGEVRRLLGDCLGPSDFRKNAGHIARELKSCPPALVDLLELRLPGGAAASVASDVFRAIDGTGPVPVVLDDRWRMTIERLDERSRRAVAGPLAHFQQEAARSPHPFSYSDCSLGNLVFAGVFLDSGRRFNAAVDAYCALVGLPAGLLENVTDGTNAFLVALTRDRQIIPTEEAIVDATLQNRVEEIFLLDRPLDDRDRETLARLTPGEVAAFLESRTQVLGVNPRLVDRLRDADLIIYSAGTQHSSLFPSYLTPRLSEAIGKNLKAIKLLITNIQTDAEIAGSSAVDIIERAVHYLKEKSRLSIPTPCLITHYAINAPSASAAGAYVVPGQLDALEDPRPVRIANYEDGVTGRHDAAKILEPFVDSLLEKRSRRRVGILLHDASSVNTLSQTLLEMVRGGIQELPLAVSVFYDRPEPLPPDFTRALPFDIRNLAGKDGRPVDRLRCILREEDFDYLLLFESSGMYRGEDAAALASHLAIGRVDAVWGSRRLSVREIHESYRFRYRHHVALGAVSYAGSYLLSLGYLLLYGRYISDTLSAARAVRAAYACAPDVDLTHRLVNQHLLSAVLRDQGEILEFPVQFLPLSPHKVRRTTVGEGLQALGTIVWRRFAPKAIADPPAESKPALQPAAEE